MRLRPVLCSLLWLLSLLVACESEPPPVAAPASPTEAAAPADAAGPASSEPANSEPASSEKPAPREGARPAINADFRNPQMDVASWVERFETESREIAAHRDELAALLALKPGEAVADIGAGTGLFEEAFAKAVGPTGKVYAVDLSPAFLDHLRQRVKDAGWTQVEVVACDDRSTNLKPASVDAAFICDTYHHFEHPAETMASLLSALRPGGRLLVVDFERVPGQSRDWVLEHVRCGKKRVRTEIEAAGFRWLRDVTPAVLAENYAMLFEAPAADPQAADPAARR